MVSRPRCPRLPRLPRGRVDGSRLAHGEMVGEVQMAERSPEVEGSRPENDRISWRNPDSEAQEDFVEAWATLKEVKKMSDR